MKVLSADDSLIMRKIVAGAASLLGYETIEAKNGMEAIAKLKAHRDEVALVILDWNMPVMNGFDALVEIRADDSFRDIPILMATSESEKKNVVRAIQAGANNYLPKPFDKAILAKKMAEMLSMEVTV
ncbi:MAG TPA: response regulator [candidate division Zixibacteria bacterium]|nr:response regulator [candidate division Zixibacteria bacterium]